MFVNSECGAEEGAGSWNAGGKRVPAVQKCFMIGTPRQTLLE